jgi:hypothetical protein
MNMWPLLSRYIADEVMWRGYCGCETPCDHNAKLDPYAIIDEYDDLQADELHRRL